MEETEKSIKWFISQLINVISANLRYTQPAFTCSKLTIETLEQGVKYVQR